MVKKTIESPVRANAHSPACGQLQEQGEDRRMRQKWRKAINRETNCKSKARKETEWSPRNYPPSPFQDGCGYETVVSGTHMFLFTLHMIKFFIMHIRII